MKSATSVVRLSTELKTMAKKSADKKELTLSSWIRLAIIDKLHREQKKPGVISYNDYLKNGSCDEQI